MAGKHKERIGQVISDKMAKTVIVEIKIAEKDALYNKNITKTETFKVHDENKVSKVGDKVRIVETRPLSRDKRWRVAEVITKGEVVDIKPAEVA